MTPVYDMQHGLLAGGPALYGLRNVSSLTAPKCIGCILWTPIIYSTRPYVLREPKDLACYPLCKRQVNCFAYVHDGKSLI